MSTSLSLYAVLPVSWFTGIQFTTKQRRYHRKDQGKMENGREQFGGSVNCWPLIVKKNRWLNKNGRTQCGDGTNWLYEMKMEAEHQTLVSRMIASADGGARLAAQDHETNGVESRSAGSEGGRRKMPSR